MKERILHSSFELFMNYGVRSVSMDDIAKHLSISKKTIYQFYKDKDELVQELMNKKLKEDEKDIKAIIKESENVVEECFNIMKHLGKMMRQINPSFFYDLQKYHPKTWNLFKEFKEKCILKMIEDSFARGSKQGLIRMGINTKILSRMRMEQIEMCFNPGIFPPHQFKIIDVQLSLQDHFLHGMCTLKGHKLINKYKQIIEEE